MWTWTPAGAGLSPSPADRARQGLADDYTQTDREIALRMRVRPATVRAVRRRLEDLAVIPPQAVPSRRAPRGPVMPVMPEAMARGLCAAGGYDADLWTSDRRDERELAARICRACAVRPVCLEWSLSLPASDTAVYAGQGASWRRQERRRRAGKPPASWETVTAKNAARQHRRPIGGGGFQGGRSMIAPVPLRQGRAPKPGRSRCPSVPGTARRPAHYRCSGGLYGLLRWHTERMSDLLDAKDSTGRQRWPEANGPGTDGPDGAIRYGQPGLPASRVHVEPRMTQAELAAEMKRDREDGQCRHCRGIPLETLRSLRQAIGDVERRRV